MVIVLQALDSRVAPHSPTLREETRYPPPTRGAKQYLVLVDGRECGFVSLDHLPESTDIVIYEIFIEPAHRRRGLGTAVMRRLEQLATGRGCLRIVLCPEPIDSTLTRDELIGWYKRLGYRPSAQSKDVMEKSL